MLYIDGKQNYVQIKGVKVKLGMKPQKREFFRFLRESGQNLKFSAFVPIRAFSANPPPLAVALPVALPLALAVAVSATAVPLAVAVQAEN